MPLTRTVHNDAATFEVGRQLLEVDPIMIIGGGVLFVILLVILQMWRNNTKIQLVAELERAVDCWKDALLDKTISIYELLCTSSPTLFADVNAFDNESRVAYKQARIIWSAWLAKRFEMEKILEQSGALEEYQRERYWWEISHRRLRRALNALSRDEVEINTYSLRDGFFAGLANAAEPFKVKSKELPGSLIIEALAVEREYLRFSEAFKRARADVLRLKEALNGSAAVNSGGLNGASAKLVGAGLPLSPYQERLSALILEAAELERKIEREPLWEHASVLRETLERIGELERELTFALVMQKDFTAVSGQMEEARSHIDRMRAEKVPSGLPGVQVFGAWRLDEEGFNPDPWLTKAQIYLAQWQSDLVCGRLTTLVDLKTAASDAVSTALKLVEKAREEKLLIETQLAEITSSSTAADLDADQQAREASVAGYMTQRWSQVLSQTTSLFALHLKRRAARAEASSLSEQLSAIGRELAQNAHIVSADLDQSYAVVVGQAETLQAEAWKGSADWDDLQAAVVTLRTARVSDGNNSLRARLDAELAAHEQAMNDIEALRRDLADLDSKLAQNWGGGEAKSLLARVRGAVEQTLAEAHTPKQNWLRLSRLVHEAYERMAPAQALVDFEVARDQSFYQRLSQFNAELDTCRQQSYKRLICGVEYGLGIYCALDMPLSALPKLKELYKQRRYEQMDGLLQQAVSELLKNHVDAWWMCLQALSMSLDPCARAFARENGYDECGYEGWKSERILQSSPGRFYNLPEIVCEKHKPEAYLAGPVGDLPVMQDYQGLA